MRLFKKLPEEQIISYLFRHLGAIPFQDVQLILFMRNTPRNQNLKELELTDINNFLSQFYRRVPDNIYYTYTKEDGTNHRDI